MLAKLTVTAGLVLGGALLFALARPEFFTLERVLAADGPWDLSLAQFLTTRANPLALDVPELLRSLRLDELGRPAVILFAVPVVLAIVTVVLCFSYWPPVPALTCAAVSLLTIFVAAYVAFYLACGLLWGINTLNFWILLIILALYQWYRRAL